MADRSDRSNRDETYPSLTAREHWGRYSAGILTETLFVGGLMAVALLLAVVAVVIW